MSGATTTLLLICAAIGCVVSLLAFSTAYLFKLKIRLPELARAKWGSQFSSGAFRLRFFPRPTLTLQDVKVTERGATRIFAKQVDVCTSFVFPFRKRPFLDVKILSSEIAVENVSALQNQTLSALASNVRELGLSLWNLNSLKIFSAKVVSRQENTEPLFSKVNVKLGRFGAKPALRAKITAIANLERENFQCHGFVSSTLVIKKTQNSGVKVVIRSFFDEAQIAYKNIINKNAGKAAAILLRARSTEDVVRIDELVYQMDNFELNCRGSILVKEQAAKLRAFARCPDVSLLRDFFRLRFKIPGQRLAVWASAAGSLKSPSNFKTDWSLQIKDVFTNRTFKIHKILGIKQLKTYVSEMALLSKRNPISKMQIH